MANICIPTWLTWYFAIKLSLWLITVLVVGVFTLFLAIKEFRAKKRNSKESGSD